MTQTPIIKMTPEQVLEYLDRVNPAKANKFRSTGFIFVNEVIDEVYKELGFSFRSNNTVQGWYLTEPVAILDFNQTDVNIRKEV